MSNGSIWKWAQIMPKRRVEIDNVSRLNLSARRRGCWILHLFVSARCSGEPTAKRPTDGLFHLRSSTRPRLASQHQGQHYRTESHHALALSVPFAVGGFPVAFRRKASQDFRAYPNVPLIVISPFTKKNYVSHTAADYTAILKCIETTFKLPALTLRDAAQPDRTEFFDFPNAPWATPPTPPTDGTCKDQDLPEAQNQKR